MLDTTSERGVETAPNGTSVWKPLWDALRSLPGKVRVQRKPHTLRLRETLALGERRFLAVVQWGEEKLLVGVTPQSITLLEPQTKKEARRSAWEEEESA